MLLETENNNFYILQDANINALDFDLYTPLHEAVIHSDYEMVSMLLYYGADADSACSNGLTPFMMAVHLNVDVEVSNLKWNNDA